MSLIERIKLHYSHNRPPVHVHVDAFTALDYNYIDEGIFIGTNQCCTVGLSEVLEKEGIRSDLSLEEERIDQPYGTEEYVWLPIPNHGIPTDAQLAFAIMTLSHWVKEGRKVYVHCRNGHGRSSTVLSAYLIKTRGYTPEQALAFVQAHRPTAHIQDTQATFLQKYYKECMP